ncbi:alpha/beta hydrolase [Pseudomaricurvus alkylphenolicus]|uniref:alpha/beta hydrolase n=1 Tax=Pseudomaricurvus alkylphenolicus TaxID=1306991 RepID=UPI0014229319|nr:alpha/beta hydrolase [Pseudomaricurvus alkylphenolicus]NIB38209.1 alpha/beta hydrolase [Pseudomaricurvus alkylphenolicus]
MSRFNVEQKGWAGELDHQVKEVLAQVASSAQQSDQPPPEKTPASVRSAPDALQPFYPPAEPLEEVTDVHIKGPDADLLRLRIYQPDSEATLPVLLFLHGGCWVFCSIDSHDSLCRYIARHGHCVVVSVDYRLAPEHPFPAALEDAYAATSWVRENIGRYGGDGSRLAVGGDSAGGNLAAALTLLCRQRHGHEPGPLIAAQWLMYPITNPGELSTDSHRRFARDYFFETEFYVWAREHYLGEVEDRTQPLVAPLLCADLSGLPPALIQTAEFDILRDEGEHFGLALHNQNIDTRVVRYNGMVHAFVAMAGQVDMGRVALRDGIEFLHKHWRKRQTS